MKKLLTLSILFTFFSNAPLHGVVEPPNYNFSLDALAFFMPGRSFQDMEKQYGKGELMLENGKAKTYRFYVAQIRYKFPVYVNIIEDKSVDFHARLPSYFSHYLFHQALINRYGKQDRYLKKEQSALYIWKNKENARHTYSGTCTITCFPIFYSVSAEPLPPGHRPVLEKLAMPHSAAAPSL